MRTFQCLIFVLKRSYICYYIICVTVPLIAKMWFNESDIPFATHVYKLAVYFASLAIQIATSPSNE